MTVTTTKKVVPFIIPAERMVRVTARVSQTSGATYLSAATCGPVLGGAIRRKQEGRNYEEPIAAQMVRVGAELFASAFPDEPAPKLTAGYTTADGTELVVFPMPGHAEEMGE